MGDRWNYEPLRFTFIFPNDTIAVPSRYIANYSSATDNRFVSFAYGSIGDTNFNISAPEELGEKPVGMTITIIDDYIENDTLNVSLDGSSGIVIKLAGTTTSKNSALAIQQGIRNLSDITYNSNTISFEEWVVTADDYLDNLYAGSDTYSMYAKYTTPPSGVVITDVNFSDDDAITSGNAIGTITSSKLYLSIFDSNNYLDPTNINSPYYGNMGAGVKILAEISYDGGLTYDNFGTYFTNGDWSIDFSNGLNDIAVISALDIVDYAGNKKMPKLPAKINITLEQLLMDVVTEINKTSKEEINIRIHEDLHLDLKYGVVYGEYVRDFWNLAAQALIARVKMANDGAIEFLPAMTASNNTYTITDDMIIGKIGISNNNSIVYNKVSLTYGQMSILDTDVILRSNEMVLHPGTNNFNELQFDNKVICITDTYFETDSELDNSEEIVIDNLLSTGNQDTVDVSVNNNASVDVIADLIIEGVALKALEVTNEKTIPGGIDGKDPNAAKTFKLYNKLIQTKDNSDTLLDNVLDYFSMYKQIISINTILTMQAMNGDTIVIDSDLNTSFNGQYRLVNSNKTPGVSYNNIIDLVKIPEV